MSVSGMAGAVQAPERPLQGLDFPFVIDLLSLGEFQCFQHQLHFFKRALELLDHLIHLIDRPADRGGRPGGFRFPPQFVLGLHGGRRWLSQFALFGRGRCRGARPTAASRMAAATVPGPARFFRGRRRGRVGRGVRFYVWGHTHL